MNIDLSAAQLTVEVARFAWVSVAHIKTANVRYSSSAKTQQERLAASASAAAADVQHG